MQAIEGIVNDDTWNPSEANVNIAFFWDRNCVRCGVFALFGFKRSHTYALPRLLGTNLLTHETSSFCCGPNGNRLNDDVALPPLPREFAWLTDHPNISRLSRKLNHMFTFTAFKVSGNLPPTQDGFVAIEGRSYHRIRPNCLASCCVCP